MPATLISYWMPDQVRRDAVLPLLLTPILLRIPVNLGAYEEPLLISLPCSAWERARLFTLTE